MAALPLIAKLRATSDISDEDAGRLSEICASTTTIARKADIISEGVRPRFMHLIRDGWAARYRILPNGSRQITALLIPGDFCDLHVTVLAAMDHGITAITECRVACVDPETLDRLIADRPAIARAMWRSTLVDEAVLREWIVNVGRRTALEPIAHLLSELHLRMRIVGLVDGDCFHLPLTQEELGDATGLTAVHVNRTLGELRSRGLIEHGERKLTVVDVAHLRRLAGFSPNYFHLHARH